MLNPRYISTIIGAALSHALMAALIIAGPASARLGAQQLPFNVPMVGWDSAALVAQRHAYRGGRHHEQLFCIDRYQRGVTLRRVVPFLVLHVRPERIGEAHRIADVGSLCHGPNNAPLPTLHTHSDGNCQFSPRDLATVAARGAPFDGIQCGEHHFVWQSAWEVNAIANELERERRGATTRRHRR